MLKSFINKLIDFFGSKDWEPYAGKEGLIMRRRLPGRWEYRAPTAAEIEEELLWQAIK
ncbi:hypothetical protein HJB80_02685 [Rhizobium lentis]|uniref:hypothetical protein n=1 Tax=Rhizobium lentis TaxID=1138194 RepID=UPI001C836F90|nr:hypothetical protein [Rhizobium lentis]MBX5131600.1 hypothetical protein [Rhizobium lentis]